VDQPKTKPCPVCGHVLKLPTEYLDAMSKLRAEVEKFRGVILKDYEHDHALQENTKCCCDIPDCDCSFRGKIRGLCMFKD
jgi:hypothetical protein